MAELLRGAPVAAAINDTTRARVESLRASGIVPTLAIVRVGDNGADISYERGAMKRCAGLDIAVKNVTLPEEAAEAELLREIDSLNRDGSVHGVLILRPLPRHMDDNRIRDALDPDKDVDGITDGSLAGLFTGSGRGFCPCTAEGCVRLLDFHGIDCEGRRVVVVGRSLVIGKPVSQLLLARNATVTVCHTRTRDLAAETGRADVIVTATGRAGTITKAHVAPDQVVIDVGVNTGADGRMCGDADFEEVSKIVRGITPVPGGVGAVTTAVLAEHVVTAAERRVQSSGKF